MAEFFFTHKAVEDLKDIWHYTVQAWSEHQAENYYEAIIQCCNDLASQPGLGRSYEFVESGVFGFKMGQHIIFYRCIGADEIEIIRILHGSMDLKNHL